MAENTPSGSNGGGQNTSGSQSGVGGGTGAGSGAGINNPNLGAGGGGNVIDISEDTLVRLPGAKEPVRYGDHYRGFQSQFTKRAQEAAELRREHQRLLKENEDYKRRVQAGQQQQGQAQRPNKLQELAGQLKSLQYLNGEQAANVVDHVMQELSASAQELQRRDLALGLMYRQMKEMRDQLGGIQSARTETEFNSKIARVVKEQGLPQKAVEWAKKLYLAYEGDGLDEAFPQILKDEWEAIGGIVKQTERERIEAARRAPFTPGRGGNGSPSQPLRQDWAKKSAKEIADVMWPTMVDGDVET